MRELAVTLCGLFTSLLTALVLWWVADSWELAVYTITAWVILPVGAAVSGFAGATGYLAGSRLLHHRPSRLMLLNIIIVSVFTFFAVHYLDYITLEIDGTPISAFLSFGQYMDISIRSTSIEFLRRGVSTGAETGELGNLGYGIAALQVLGFALGGLAVYGYLVSRPYCRRCSRFMFRKGLQTRYTEDPEGLQASTAQVYSDFASGDIGTAIQNHGLFGNRECAKDDYLRSWIEIMDCKQCGRHWARYRVEKRGRDDWKEIPDLTVEGFTESTVDMEDHAAAQTTR